MAFAADASAHALEVRVDPRVELASLVVDMTPWARENTEPASSAYASEALRAFAKYSDHLSVSGCNEWLGSEHGDLDVLLRLALSLKSDFTDGGAIDPELAQQAGGVEMADHLVTLLRQFATDSHFDAFYQAHAAFYAKLTERVASPVTPLDVPGHLESYYGTHFESYALVLAPLAPRETSAEAVAIDLEPSGPVVVMRADGATKDKLPDFKESSLAFDRELRHALGRAFVDPLATKHASDLEASVALYQPITEDMKSRHLDTWRQAFSEHLLRAIDARFLQAEGESKEAQLELRADERAGFGYVRSLFDQLANFEANRTSYPTLAAFMPTVLAQLSYLKDTGADQDVAKRYLSFQGPLSRADDKRYLSSTVFVAPTPKDPKLKAVMATYMQAVKALYKKHYHRDVRLVTPEEAAKLSPGTTSYVILGTPWSNPFLAALLKYIPLKVSKNTIQLGEKQYIGKNLRLITAFANPYNPKLPMRILTGTEDAGIPGIFTMPYGSTDFIVFQDARAIAEGDFVYDLKGKWSLH